MEELFEFDLSDVDVAAFESVATTPPHSSSATTTVPTAAQTITELQQQPPTQHNEDQEHQHSIIHHHHLHHHHHQQSIATPHTSSTPPPLAVSHNNNNATTTTSPSTATTPTHSSSATTMIATTTSTMTTATTLATTANFIQTLKIAGQQPCKILLIPINPPSASPLAMSALKSGNKKQIIQAAPKNENNEMIANEVPKRKPCNCTKSQCLKLYCDCFANGEFCSGCNCTNCFNSLSKEKERQKAITQCLERNPEAFRPKIGKAIKSSIGEPAPDSIERRHTKGCNCKRSGCLKNYCECYEAKILCSNLCKCCGCKNYEESFERKTLMQLANSSSESARGILKNLLPTNNNLNTGKEFTKCFITDRVIHASLVCLLQSAQQAEKDGTQPSKIPSLIQTEMGKCLRMIVDSANESANLKKR